VFLYKIFVQERKNWCDTMRESLKWTEKLSVARSIENARPDNAAPDHTEMDNFDNCLRIVESTPSYASVGVDRRLFKVSHRTRRCKLRQQLLYFLEHFYVQFGRLPRHQRVTHWKREISEVNKQSKQLIIKSSAPLWTLRQSTAASPTAAVPAGR